MILRRDSNKLVRSLVLRNPRISEDEIIVIAADRQSDKAVLQAIADHPDWAKIYAVRRALVDNPLTPIVASLRLLTSLSYQHLQALAKHKGIPGAGAIQALRLAARNSENEATRERLNN